jgi:hypothetical protein
MNEDIYEDNYWRYGVVLHYENTMAMVKEKYFENKITIELKGDNRREFLFSIRKAITEIHKDFNKLEVYEMIPCNCTYCQVADTPHFYEHKLLLKYESREIPKIRCELSLEEVKVFELTSDISKKSFTDDKVIICENQNASVLNSIHFDKLLFVPERDSGSVFMKVVGNPDFYGLRDRDFLLDSEITKIRTKFPKYYILRYYCFENYLYHPDNIEELNLSDFNKKEYINEIIKQKKDNKNHIISIFKKSRDSYQEFKIQADNFRNKAQEVEIMDCLESDNFEDFYKFFSMKDKFNKEIIAKYRLTKDELAGTKWFKQKMKDLFNS